MAKQPATRDKKEAASERTKPQPKSGSNGQTNGQSNGKSKGKPEKRPADAEAKAAAQKQAQKQAAQQPPPDEEDYSSFEAFQEWLREAPSWLTSAVVHAVILLIMALVIVPSPFKEDTELIGEPLENEIEDFEDIEQPDPEDLEIEVPQDQVFQPVQGEATDQAIDVATVDDVAAAPVEVELSVGLDTMPKGDIMSEVGGIGDGRGLQGRGNREALVRQRGGTPESEKAVEMALKWLAEHQLPDGGWSYDHTGGLCQGRCSHPGTLKNGRLAATGMALLPFLGAGNTHKKGKYSRNVQAGLYYLINNAKVTPNGAGFNHDQGRMYGHGICAIALCEAYGMTQDKWLFQPAQQSLNFIAYAQDPVGGGWRYEPRTPGDTSVVGWQLMALKSGHMAYLQVDPNTIKGAWNFLNTVQSDSGSAYGYTGPGGGAARSAIGLLSRMYLGWKKDHPALQRGVARMSQQGPSNGDMYYNYYATQVMAHMEGEVWKKWNPQMRDYLVAQQSKAGHETGSWFLPNGDHGSERGGRLYTTCMATMVLEVYYRHMPIYRKQASEEEFPD